MRLSDLVSNVAHSAPDRALITMGDVRLSYGEVADRASTVAAALRSSHVGTGDRVVVLSRTTPEFFELIVGADMAGAVIVALNWRLALDEMRSIVDDSGVTLIVASDEYRSNAAQLADEVDSVELVVIIGPEYETWRSADDPLGTSAVDAQIVDTDRSDAAVMLQLYTSGTTGTPKGVMCSAAAAEFTLPKVAESWGFDEHTVALVPMPLFHIGGIGWSLVAIQGGGRLVLLDAPSAADILDAIERERVTDIMVVPAQLPPLCDELEKQPRDLSSLRTITYAASPIAQPVLLRTITTFGCALRQIYGQTECFGPVCQLEPDDHVPEADDVAPQDHLASCGRPVAWAEVAIVDPETGEPVPDGERGELWTRSPQNMIGYWGRPDQTADTIRTDGWLRTGDIAEMRGGYVYLVDRLNDLIITGGENVFPAEVERVLMDHPAVADVAIVGIRHERWGETPSAAVVVAADAEVSAPALIEFCRERLAHYKCPTSIHFVDAIPRNPTGKIIRRGVRDQLAAVQR